jgi:hypothetical protein
LGPPLRAIVRVFDAAGTLGLAAGISVHARSGMSRIVVANYLGSNEHGRASTADRRWPPGAQQF